MTVSEFAESINSVITRFFVLILMEESIKHCGTYAHTFGEVGHVTAVVFACFD